MTFEKLIFFFLVSPFLMRTWLLKKLKVVVSFKNSHIFKKVVRFA